MPDSVGARSQMAQARAADLLRAAGLTEATAQLVAEYLPWRLNRAIILELEPRVGPYARCLHRGDAEASVVRRLFMAHGERKPRPSGQG